MRLHLAPCLMMKPSLLSILLPDVHDVIYLKLEKKKEKTTTTTITNTNTHFER